MKTEGYPHGIVFAVLGRAKRIERDRQCSHEHAVEVACREFTSRSNIDDMQRARAEIDDLLAQLDRMGKVHGPG